MSSAGARCHLFHASFSAMLFIGPLIVNLASDPKQFPLKSLSIFVKGALVMHAFNVTSRERKLKNYDGISITLKTNALNM